MAQQHRVLQQLGYEIDLLYVDSQRSLLTYLWSMARVFYDCQVRKRYDLVHAHYGFCGVVARMQFRCPVVVTFRGSDVLKRREWLVSWPLARFIDASIVMTEEMKNLLGRQDIHVIPYGIDLDLFRPEDQKIARQVLHLPAESPLVLFPYDPTRSEKRFDLAEQAVAIVRDQFPDTQIVTIADKPHELMARFMSACDVMLLTSETEGAPVAVREAMACNLPITSVPVGDVAKLISEISGCYLAASDPRSIAEKLTRVFSERKRTNARQKALGMSVTQSALRVAAVYEEIFDGGRNSHESEVQDLAR